MQTLVRMQDDDGWTVSAVPDNYSVERASQVQPPASAPGSWEHAGSSMLAAMQRH